MALFLPIVLNEELKNLDDVLVRSAFERLKTNFSTEIQKHILDSSEIELQGEFIELLFDNVLGYTRFPKPKWHVKREQNSAQSSERADAAIAQNSDENQVIGVIELKGTDTHDLKSVERQVFKYFNQHPNCRYAIASNYQSVRLYIDNNQGYEEFNIFDLVNNDDYERFKLLYCYLNKDAVLGNKTQVLRQQSIIKEKEVTASLYMWYKKFRIELFDGLKASNKTVDKFTLYQKTQKLLDRFLFILFAEDKDLLPRFTIKTHINNWAAAGRKGSLLQVFQALFQELNTGNKTKNIFAYNGGLFAPDDIIDSLKLPIGNILEIYLLELEAYDYKTQVDVAILGHIFEQSLNDLDEMKALAAGETLDKSKTKRKKDGVFYTPQYITRYIIENTLGALCAEKRTALGIVAGKKTTERTLLTYRDWLNTVTVLDPACGSGAFLSEVLTFFIGEHEAIEERIAGATGKPVIYKDHALNILENNIFGVDLNEEAVEIAKLSLWLRTAQQGRKLSNLSKNIKAGNSLVDDPAVSDKAFDWKREFPNVFKNGGFDVVVGNPPYVLVFDTDYKTYYENEYPIFKRNNDLYVAFYEKSLKFLCKKQGFFGFITPNTFIKGDYFKDLRSFISELQIRNITDFGSKLVFEGANVFSAISIIKNTYEPEKWILNSDIGVYKGVIEKKITDFIPQNMVGLKIGQFQIMEDFFLIKDVGYNYWTEGRGKVRGESIGSRILYSGSKQHKNDIPYIKGGDFVKWSSNIKPENYLKHNYSDFLDENDTFRFSKEILETTPKIIYRQTSNKIVATLDFNSFHTDKTVHCILNKNNFNFNLKFVLSLLNSRLYNYLYQLSTEEEGRAFAQVKTVNIKKLPFSNFPPKAQLPFIALADKMLSTNEKIETLRADYVAHLQGVFPALVLNKKINDWHGDTWQALVAELRKQKYTLLPKQETVTKTEFERVQSLLKGYQTMLQRTDAEIDQKVYALYDLTAEEIAMIELG